MSSEKTEEPTQHKIDKAREDGQVAHSKDLTQTVLVLCMFGYILWNAASIIRDFSEMIMLPAAFVGMDFGLAADALAAELTRRGVEMLAPFLGIVIVVGLAVEWTQTGMLIAFKALAPSGKKLDVAANLKNMFAAKNMFEFVKSFLKVTLLSVVVYEILRRSLPTLVTMPHGGLASVGVATAMLLQTLMVWVALSYSAVALADFIFQRRNYTNQLKMSKEEVDRERKDMEGNDHIKRKRKELHKEMLQQDDAGAVKNSSAVITNPTHLAIAIAYRPGVTRLPVVLAKGQGARAHRIAALARQEGIPVLQNIPLARALMAKARPGDFIPADLIGPVSEVLRLVREMKESESDQEPT